MRDSAWKGPPCAEPPSPGWRPPVAAVSIVPAVASAAVETWPATPGDKVFPASTRPAGAAAGPLIAAARDEYEGAQVAIRSDVPAPDHPHRERPDRARDDPRVRRRALPGRLRQAAQGLDRRGRPRGRRPLPRPALPRAGRDRRARQRDDQRLRPGPRAGRRRGRSLRRHAGSRPGRHGAPRGRGRAGHREPRRLHHGRPPQPDPARQGLRRERGRPALRGAASPPACCRCCAPTG